MHYSIALVAAALLTVLPETGIAATKLVRSEVMKAISVPHAICIGRFSLNPAAGWVVSDRNQRMYLTDLNDTPPQLSGSNDSILDHLRHGLPSKAPLIRRFEIDDVGPAAWFGLGNHDSFDRQLVAVSGALRLQLLSSKGREAPAEKAIRMIASGYRTGARNGFCLANGAMQLEPSRNETSDLNLEATAWPNTRFTLHTRAVDQTDGTHPMMNPQAELAGIAASGVRVNLLAETPRSVAGLMGRELRGEILASTGVAPYRFYRFFFSGVGRRSAAPLMLLSLEGPATEQIALDKAWNELLESIQPVPLQ